MKEYLNKSGLKELVADIKGYSLDKLEKTQASATAAESSAAAAVSSASAAKTSAENAEASASASKASASSAEASASASAKSASDAIETITEIKNSEASRVEAENKRVSAEASRVEAENKRVSAEASRVEAENKRVSAEASRETRATSDHTQATNDHSDAVTAINNAKNATVNTVSAISGANAATTTANKAAENANTAATNADKAREQITKQAESDHTQAEADHGKADTDHTTAGSDHAQAEADHGKADTDHTTAESDHAQAEADHGNAVLTTESQGLTDEQKENARANIEAAKESDLTDLAQKLYSEVDIELSISGLNRRLSSAFGWSTTEANWNYCKLDVTQYRGEKLRLIINGITIPSGLDTSVLVYAFNSDSQGATNYFMKDAAHSEGYAQGSSVAIDDTIEVPNDAYYILIFTDEGSAVGDISTKISLTSFVDRLEKIEIGITENAEAIYTNTNNITTNTSRISDNESSIEETTSKLYDLTGEERLGYSTQDLNNASSWEQGTINSATGTPATSATRCRSIYLRLKKDATISYTKSTADVTWYVYCYDADKAFLGRCNDTKIRSGLYTLSMSDVLNENPTTEYVILGATYDFGGDPQAVVDGGTYSQCDIIIVEKEKDDNAFVPKTNTRLDALENGAGCRYTYYGQKITLFPKIDFEKIAETTNHSSVQGSACYGDMLFLFHDGSIGTCEVINLKTAEVVQVIDLGVDETHHNNNANFGIAKYDDSDAYPLLYVSQEDIAQVLVYRITGDIGSLSMTIVQTITLPTRDVDSKGITYPNTYIDKRGYLIMDGLMSIDSVIYMMFAGFKLPSITDGDSTLEFVDNLFYFKYPRTSWWMTNSATAKQSGIVQNGLLYQCVGGAMVTDPNPYLRVIDLDNGKILTTINFAEMGISKEPESCFIWDNNLCVSFNGSGNIIKLILE